MEEARNACRILVRRLGKSHLGRSRYVVRGEVDGTSSGWGRIGDFCMNNVS
jgi:hypothetical protein